MDTVIVKKTDLLDTLTANREKHQANYEEARSAYRQKVVDELRDRAKSIGDGGKIDLTFRLPEPEDHTADYDDAIAALQWHTGEEVELDRRGDFQAWVLNKWRWEQTFAANTMSYTSR